MKAYDRRRWSPREEGVRATRAAGQSFQGPVAVQWSVQSHPAAVAVGMLALLAHLLAEQVMVALEATLVAQPYPGCRTGTSHAQRHAGKLGWKRSTDQPLILDCGLGLALAPRTEA